LTFRYLCTSNLPILAQILNQPRQTPNMSANKQYKSLLHFPYAEERIHSIYIPLLNSKVTEEAIQSEMEKFIGKIDRVVITDVFKRSTNNYHSEYMRSAYIYFDPHAPQEMYVEHIKEWWKRNEPYCYKNFAQQNYIHIYDNTLSAVEVRRRNSSAVQLNEYPLQKFIELQQQQIETLEKKVKASQDVLYDFIGGLYCQRTQGEEIEKLIANLCDRPPIDVTENDDEESEQPKPEKQTSKWSFWPTTRQGDECEREIEALKEEIKMLKSQMTPQKKPKTISQLRKFLQEDH
jgi:hypothetical protein